MIVTVTFNPAVDKTVEIERLERGGLNRIKRIELDVGGKGINVSKTIRELGGESIAVGFLAGNTGRMIERALGEMGIRTDFIYVDGETRTNTKVIEADGTVTELNEAGAAIDKGRIGALLEKLEGYADENTLFVLAGSVPSGVDKMVYADIIRLAHKKGACVLLDADGELLKNALEVCPDMIKPNREELEEYVGHKCENTGELVQAAGELSRKGIGLVAVTMGSDGAIIAKGDCVVKSRALSVEAHSTVGAGDAFVAALAYAWENGLDDDELMRLCMAASAGAVTTVGTKPPAKELVERLKKEVVVERVG